MEDHETNLDDIIAPFFDAKILNDIRNSVLILYAPGPYDDDPGTIYEPGIDTRSFWKVWEAMKVFIRNQKPLGANRFHELRTALQRKVNDFEAKIRDTLYAATFRLYIWAKDAPHVWTTDRHDYGLLRQPFGDIGVYYILHLTKKTIAFIDDADVMDQAIEELLRIDIPIYTELPWPVLNWQDRRNRLLGKSNADNEHP